MKNGYIKTAAATPYITVADCNANGNEIIRLIHEMEKEHVKVMVFPELCITGYTCQDLFLQRRLLDSAWETLLKITKETADVWNMWILREREFLLEQIIFLSVRRNRNLWQQQRSVRIYG